MRIFRDFIEAYYEVEREINHNGVLYQTQTVQDQAVAENPDFLTKELIGYSFTVKDPKISLFINHLGLNKEWIREEFNERVSNTRVNPGKAYLERKETWEPFLHEGFFSYTYSGRIGNQVLKVINLLKQKPFSRHGLINIYWPNVDNQNDRRNGKVRIPCTMYYWFFIRKENNEPRLHILYNIRSNDFSTHFPYDIVLARMLQVHIANQLSIGVGDFLYQSGSLHCFKKDRKEIF